MSGILEEVKQSFKNGNALTKIIYINVAIYLIISIISAIFYIFRIEAELTFLNWLMVPAFVPTLVTRPWTIISYMFLHTGFFHILFNMLWLYWLGRIFIDMLGGKRLLTTYLLGGISGAILYIVAFNILPAFEPSQYDPSFMLGASASVMAIGIATATYFPDYQLNLMFIGEVRLKYIAVCLVILDLIFLVDGNAGGHIAHLGGAVYGFIWASKMKQGKDIARWFGYLSDKIANLFKPKSKIKISYRNDNQSNYSYSKPQNSNPQQREIDAILDKIATSGYESLSAEEKNILFKMSNRK